MRQIRWSPDAAADLVRIVEYIRADNSPAAERVARSILRQIANLKEFPETGRSGRIHGTRELALSPLPFIVVYRVKQGVVEIARVLHGAQRWP